MDPFEAGAIVIEGMLRNDPFIRSSAEFERVIRERSGAGRAAGVLTCDAGAPGSGVDQTGHVRVRG